MADAPRPALSYEERRVITRANSRLSTPYSTRLTIATFSTFLIGMGLGMSHGAKTVGLRFRAENAHRLPETPTGWYLYHKSKNYHMALGGLKEGLKMGGRMVPWVASFFILENSWDEIRQTKDFFNTVLASLTVAGGFSLWNRFPLATAARTAKTGLGIGLAYGLAQDVVGAMRGRRPGYVDFVLRWRKPKGETMVTDIT